MRTAWPQLLASCVATLLLATGSARADAPAPPAAEVFGQIPRIANVQISPNGKLLAWADNSGPVQRVVMFDLEARKEKRRLTLEAEYKLRDLNWSDDETLVAQVSSTEGVRYTNSKYEMYRTLAADIHGNPARMLLMTGHRSWVTGAALLALRSSKPRTVVMSTLDFSMTNYTGELGSRLHGGRKDAGWTHNLFEVDTRTGKGVRVDAGSPFTVGWVVDKNGQPVARSEWMAERNLFSVLYKQGGDWKEIHSQDDGEMLTLYGLTPDETGVIAVGALGESRAKAWTLPFDGSGANILLEDATYDIQSVILDPYSRAPVGAWVGGPEPEIRWLDAKARMRSEALLRTFAGRGVAFLGRSADGSRVIAHVSSHSIPATYYLVDFSKGTADIIGEDYPALVDAPLGEVRVISYKARDGMEIPAYLTIPPGVTQDKSPLVVLPHGGPEGRDEREFDWMAQFLATRGYTVLQPQFRGSTGFGEAFRKAGYRQWGRLMQDDVTDGVKALMTQGLVDPRRVCIVGSSYGGYAALAGAAFTPELYACAISVNGISDLPGMIGYVEKQYPDEWDAIAYWKGHIGPAHDPNVIAMSPLRAAGKIRAPILLLHGVADTIVPVKQSELMAAALEERGKLITFMKLEGEDHWLSRSESRTRVLKELETFLAAHLGGGGSATSPGPTSPGPDPQPSP